MNQPLISIIVPVYNVENYIEKCLESIIKQTYQNFELLLIDDGSKDKSGELCNKYAALDKRIKVFHQTNQGVSSARNEGLKVSAGEYIAFIDADDYLETDYLETLYTDSVQFHADVVCCELVNVINDQKFYNRHTINKSRVIRGKNELYNSYRQNEQYYRNVTGRLIRRELAVKHTFMDLKYGEDTVYMLGILSEDISVYLDVYAGYCYVRRPGSAVTGLSKFNVKSNIDHVYIGEKLYMGSKECSLDNQIYALKDYSGYVYNAISYIIKMQDRNSYEKYYSFLKKHAFNILGDGRLQDKRKYMLTFYCKAPHTYWRIMSILLKIKMKLDRESIE